MASKKIEVRYIKPDKKNSRIGVVLDSELHEKLKRICYMQQTTITAVVQNLVGEFVKQNKADVKRYERIFDKPPAQVDSSKNKPDETNDTAEEVTSNVAD